MNYADVHKKAIEEAENLLKELRKVTEEALLEEKRYCEGYTLLKNTYPLSQRTVTRKEISGFDITENGVACFDFGECFRLCYADNSTLYGTSFMYDLLPEEKHIVDSVPYADPPELFTIKDLEIRTVYQSVTIDLTKKECQKRFLQLDGGIYFEKSVVVMNPDESEVLCEMFPCEGETENTIVLQQEDEPGMLVRHSDGKVEDFCPGFYAVDGDNISYKVVHYGRTPYYIEHIRTRYMIQDIVRVNNLHSGEKTYYLLPFHSILSANDLFILRDRLFYISHGAIYDANNSDHITPIQCEDINGIVAYNDYIYYQERSIIVELFIGRHPHEE